MGMVGKLVMVVPLTLLVGWLTLGAPGPGFFMGPGTPPPAFALAPAEDGREGFALRPGKAALLLFWSST